jgi:zinc protease
MRGTKKQSFQEIFENLESMGGSLGVSCGAHTAGFGGKSLADDLPALLDILADVLKEPVFPQSHIERVQSQLLTSLNLRAQDTNEMAGMGFDKIAYAGHPYENPSDGFIDQAHYGPKEMVIAVSGAVDPDQALQLTKDKFGDWVNSDQPEVFLVPGADPLEKTVRSHHLIEEKSQTDIILGVVGPPRRTEEFYPALMGNSVLGQFGMMGRIGKSVRNKAGLAYYAYSSLSSGIGPGPWTVSAGVDPQNVEQALQLITEEIKKFVTDPVTTEELQDVQSSYIGKLPLSLESNTGVAGALLTIERNQLGLDYFQQYEEFVSGITPESILEASRKYLDPGKLAISTAGP